jgi:hypothetical protein
MTGPPPPPVIDTPAERDELRCPLCDYSLRGLATPDANARCPECGYAFSWAQLLQARQHRHPYLFEQHRTVRSFFRTLLAGVRPQRFWSSLNAGHAALPLWLAVYSVAVTGLLGISLTWGHFIAVSFTQYQRNVALNQVNPGSTVLPPDPDFFREAWRTSRGEKDFEDSMISVCALWPWITLAVLMLFQASMRRARINPAHVLRCVVYSGDAFVWTGVALALVGAAGILEPYPDYGAIRPIAACVLVFVAVAGYRLGVAFARYLRIERPWAIAVASQVIYLLTVTTIMAVFYGEFWRLLW